MRHFSLSLKLALGAVLITALAALAQQKPSAVKPAATAAIAADAAPQQDLIDQYCLMCHNEQLKTAGVVLEGLHIDHVGDNTATWERVLRKFGSGQMPPPGLPRPDDETSAKFTAWLEKQLNANAQAHPNPGAPAIHRLNRLEYGNTIRDLLGLEVDVNTMLPGDDSGYGFDNIADVLSVSPVLLEKYMSAARKISRTAVGEMDMPAEESEFIVPFGTPTDVRVSEDLPLGSRGGYAIHYNFPLDAEYVIRVTMSNGGDRGAKIDTRIPIKAGPQVIGVSYAKDSPMPELTGGIGRGGAAGAGVLPGGPQKLDLRMNDVRVKLLDQPPGGQRNVYSLSVLGPYNPTGPGVTPSRKKIFVCTPASPAQEEPCARQILTNLAHHAYRGPVTNADVSPLMGFYQRGRQAGGSFDKGIEAVLRATLVSPNFLFREERDPAGAKSGTVFRLNDYELASRLSYFLWSSMPDDELLDLAQKGRLKDSAVLDQQVRRMLADDKSASLISNFSGQWLFLRNLKSDQKDKDVFPDYDQSLREAFKTETEMLFGSVLRDDGSVLDLLRANYTFLNERLAKNYGVPDVYGPAFRKVMLTDPNRFGLLGQGSILTMTSFPNRTSVVARGKWILENLLGTPPPPPPPGASDGFNPHGSSGEHLTLRQAMEQHRANPTCAVCHSRMDPIGFALENYNGIGKWRVLDDTGAKIDSSGVLPGGVTFNGPAGLTKLLLTDKKTDFVTTFTRKLMTYSLGRGVEAYDEPVIRSITREAARDDYRMSSLIMGIVHSAPFQMRRTAED